MTVGELIEKLRAFEPGMEVRIGQELLAPVTPDSVEVAAMYLNATTTLETYVLIERVN